MNDRSKRDHKREFRLAVPWGRGIKSMSNVWKVSMPTTPVQTDSDGTSLSTPWGGDCGRYLRGPENESVTKTFLEARSNVHATYILETEKTKRMGYGLSTLLLAIACIVPIFAPAGREVLSWWMSAALLVFAAGAMGFTRISLHAKKNQLRVSKEAPCKSSEG